MRSFSKMLFENPVPLNMNLRITTHPGSVSVEKMAGILTKTLLATLFLSRVLFSRKMFFS